MADSCQCVDIHSKFLHGALVIIAVLLAFMAYLNWDMARGGVSDYVSDTAYQAVFLGNGQVYFGKLVEESNDYLVMNDIYYLQRTSALQGENAVTGNDLSLIKLGNELHGPEDTMYIAKDKILFFENLKNDSRVVEAIREYKG